MRLRLDNVVFLLLSIALATLTYSPRQVLRTGVAAAIFWAVAALWVAAQPGVQFATGLGAGWSAIKPPEQMAFSTVMTPIGCLP
jgi:hypothetical protein